MNELFKYTKVTNVAKLLVWSVPGVQVVGKAEVTLIYRGTGMARIRTNPLPFSSLPAFFTFTLRATSQCLNA